jgi:hypothetical protein
MKYIKSIQFVLLVLLSLLICMLPIMGILIACLSGDNMPCIIMGWLVSLGSSCALAIMHYGNHVK